MKLILYIYTKLMGKLSIEHISSSPLRLTSTYSDGKFLTLNSQNKFSFESDDHHPHQSFSLIPKDDKFLLVAPDTSLVCHSLEDEGEIHRKYMHDSDVDETKDCEWSIGKNGELYQPHPEGGERYLWIAGDNLHVTNDGYLAEMWEIPEIEQFTQTQSSSNIFIFVFLLLIVGVYFLLKK